MNKISHIAALEILDSRGNPTVMVTVQLRKGITSSTHVPCDGSTGLQEAVELWDGEARLDMP